MTKSVRQTLTEDAKEKAESPFLLLKSSFPGPRVREFGASNLRGMWTLAFREIQRFTKIFSQTVLSPLVMVILFYVVFAMTAKGVHRSVAGIPYLHFLVPGLVLMTMIQNAFMNTASSLILSKIQGNIVDVLMAPLTAGELTIGYVAGGVVRGLLVGGLALGLLCAWDPLPVHNIGFIFYHGVMGVLLFSLMGIVTGLWGQKFDHLGAVQNFLIFPATFLSGTFFSLSDLPEGWRFLCTLNPFFYLTDGFRYGFTGISESPLWGGVGLVLIFNLAFLHIVYWMFARGTHVKT